MAVFVPARCYKCGKDHSVLAQFHEKYKVALCGECIKQQKDEKKEKELSELKKLTLEERVSKIEEWLYDNRKRIKYRDPFEG